MNLVKCKAHRNTTVKVPCCNCTSVNEVSKMFADLDGEPFITYYCKNCIDNKGKHNEL